MPPTTFEGFANMLIDLIDLTIPVIMGFSLLVFLWGLTKFIFRIEGDTKALEDGKTLIKWGLIALFVMISFQGIIMFFQDDIGFGDRPEPFLPE